MTFYRYCLLSNEKFGRSIEFDTGHIWPVMRNWKRSRWGCCIKQINPKVKSPSFLDLVRGKNWPSSNVFLRPIFFFFLSFAIYTYASIHLSLRHFKHETDCRRRMSTTFSAFISTYVIYFILSNCIHKYTLEYSSLYFIIYFLIYTYNIQLSHLVGEIFFKNNLVKTIISSEIVSSQRNG